MKFLINIIVFGVVCFLFTEIDAQNINKKIDSLSQIINNIDPIYKPETIIQISKLYVKNEEPQKAIELLNQKKEYFKLSKKQLGLFYIAKGEAYSALRNYKTAVMNFDESIKIFSELKNLINLENAIKLKYYQYEIMEKFSEAIILAKKAQEISNLDPENIHDNNSAIGYFFQRQNQLDSAEYYFQKALQIREKYKRHEEVLSSFGNLEYLYKIQGNYKKCLELIKDKENYCLTFLDSTEFGRAVYSQGEILEIIGDSSAIRKFYYSLEIGDRHNDYLLKTKSLKSIGEFYLKENKLDLALKYLNEALILANKYKFRRQEAYIEAEIGEIFSQLNEFEKAINHINKAIKINESENYDHQKAYIFNIKASILFTFKKYEDAIQNISNSIAIYNSHLDIQGIAESYLLKANIYLKQNNIPLAISSIDSVKSYNINLKLLTIDLATEDIFYKIEKQLGNHEKANIHLLKYIDYQDSLNKKNIESFAERTRIIYETHKKESENRILLREKEAANRLLKFQQIGVGIVTIILLFVIVLSIKLHKERVKLNITNLNLQNLNKFKQLMTSTIVHDLKNPLNSIIGISDISKNESEESSVIYQSGIRMLNLINNILDIQKFRDIGIKLVKNEENLFEIINLAVNQIWVNENYKKLNIENIVNADLFAEIDKDLLIRVLVNLLDNAIKYSPNEGVIKINSEKGNGFIKILVEDYGEGINIEQQDYIFDVYSQVNPMKFDKINSTGLGLSFCKLVIEAHGGNIGVISEVGIGSKFWFTIPAYK